MPLPEAYPALTQGQEKPALDQEYQVTVVDYTSSQSLQFALKGIDTVISTVTGPNQLELIKAAVSVRVRRFAPAEFEGPPQLRSPNTPLDRGQTVARQWLAYYSQHIQTTTFVCGMLYERFQPGGLRQSRIGGDLPGLANEGDYIMNCRQMSAVVPAYDANNTPNVMVCLTAAQDVGKFVTKALDLPQWPPELRMYGQRVAVKDLVLLVQRLKGIITVRTMCALLIIVLGQVFNPIQWHNPASLGSALRLATTQQDGTSQRRLHALIATAEGRYDFAQPNLNQLFPEVHTLPFQTWFIAKWNLQG